jgi:hypothetical protein
MRLYRPRPEIVNRTWQTPARHPNRLNAEGGQPMRTRNRLISLTLLGALATSTASAHAQSRFDELANLPFTENRPTPETTKTLQDELFFQRATQKHLWAMPLLNTMGMRDGFNDTYGTGYNVMAIWEKRLYDY